MESFREILGTFSFGVNFLALGSLVVGILLLLGVLQTSQYCTIEANATHPGSTGACVVLNNEVKVCDTWPCYLQSISLIVLAMLLWAIQVPYIYDYLMASPSLSWMTWAPLIIVIILVTVSAAVAVSNEKKVHDTVETGTSETRVGNGASIGFLFVGLAVLFLVTHRSMKFM